MHRSSAVLATVLSTFAITSTASAASYCVAPATGCENTATSLQNALLQAATHLGQDSISLGATTYQEDGLSYSPSDHASVTITGAGQDATVIRPQSSADSGVTLLGSGGPIDLSGLTVLTGTHAGNTAVELDHGGSLDRVQVLHDAGATTPVGVDTLAAATITNSRIVVAGNGSCVRASGTGTVRMLDSALASCSAGVVTSATRTFAQRLRITGVTNGLNVIGSGNSTANLDDSLVVLTNSAGNAASVAMFGAGVGKLYVQQDTLIGTGSGNGVSAFNHASTGAATVYVYDSIIRGFDPPFKADSDTAGHPAALNADYNDYDGTPTVTATGSLVNNHPQSADPLFVDAAHGDYHLSPSSPLIDLDPFVLDVPGGESATDLDGTVRIINGKRDLGAFERPLAPAAATGAATDVTQTSATVPASANGGGAHAAVKLVYGPSASYGSEVALDPTQADFVDRSYAVALSGLSPATTYHYALMVTNQAGTATSADQTLTTAPTPVTPPVVCCAPPPVAKAALSALKISPSRFKAASSGATFAKAKTGAKVTYTLSAAGTVSFRVYRATKGVKSGNRCVAKSPAHRTGKACTRYVAVGKAISHASAAGVTTLRFSGRIGRKKLKPGRYRLQSADPAGGTRRASFTIVRR
jgi:hypothetical protein